MTTLDALIETYGTPAFCKIDVEGMEADILQSPNTPIPLIAVEYLPATLAIASEYVERIESLGDYEFNYYSGESHAMDSGNWLGSQTLLLKLHVCET